MVTTDAILYVKHYRLVAKYIRRNRRLPRIANPRRYTERMLWRKVVNHDPKFIVFSDKLATKEYCRKVCPDLASPRTLWVGTDANSIPDDVLSGDVFVKANHGYNFNIRIRNGHVDRQKLKETTDRWLNSVYGKVDGQWSYSQIEPKLFVEEAVGDAAGDLLEFNVRASNGMPILGSVIGHNKMPEKWIAYLDTAGNPTAGPSDEDGAPCSVPPKGIVIGEPYARAVAFARRLSVGVDYARFDFMWNGSDLYAGEITVYPAGGVMELTNTAVQAATMSGWDLSVSHFLMSHHTGLKGIYANCLRRMIRRQASAEQVLQGQGSREENENRRNEIL